MDLGCIISLWAPYTSPKDYVELKFVSVSNIRGIDKPSVFN